MLMRDLFAVAKLLVQFLFFPLTPCHSQQIIATDNLSLPVFISFVLCCLLNPSAVLEYCCQHCFL